jgi:hypothetical protein
MFWMFIGFEADIPRDSTAKAGEVAKVNDRDSDA